MQLGEMLWQDEHHFTVNGVPFELSADYDPRTQLFPLRVLRDVNQLAYMDRICVDVGAQVIVEVGFFDGGSTLFYLERYSAERVLALDIRWNVAALDDAMARGAYGDRLLVGYGVSQDDETALNAQLARLECRPIDLIIDDASHMLNLSIATFEILFPHVRKGGVYILEDWGWAHQSGTQPGDPYFEHYRPQKPLSNLAFMIQMAMVSHPGLISRVEVVPSAVIVHRGEADWPTARLDLPAMCLNRGDSLTLV